MGVVVDRSGKVIRLIFNDPYGDLSQHPDVEGYYGMPMDKDTTGHRGAYAPYAADPDPTKSWDGTIPGKWVNILRRPDIEPSPATIRERLLPSESR
jgi:hypothetical protein